VVAGHTWMAFSDAEARRGMRTGKVSQEWAAREHGAWEESSRAGRSTAQAGGLPHK
jgi:formate dehydrogenase subunit gamma